jgi:hypothetical protein
MILPILSCRRSGTVQEPEENSDHQPEGDAHPLPASQCVEERNSEKEDEDGESGAEHGNLLLRGQQKATTVRMKGS